MKVFILVLSLSCYLVVSAMPQQQQQYDDDYEQTRQGRQVASQQQSRSSNERSNERESTTQIPIISQNKHQETDGSYRSSYETGNGINHEEEGSIKDVNDEHPDGILVQKGSYSYENPEGEIVEVNYEADERGFRVQSEYLPTPPPVSPEIQRGLDLIYAGIRLQEERRKKNPNYVVDKAERERLNYLGLWTGN